MRLVLVCVLLIGCSKTGAADRPLPGGGYSYLVTSSGQMLRILKTGPITGVEGKKIGTMVSYAADTRDVARLVRDAEELVAALGPEIELSGETAVVVQAYVGYDPRKTISRSVSYNVVFDLNDGRWVRSAPKKGDPKELGGVEGSLRPPEDPSFPYDPAKTNAAADAAAKWVALLDRGDASASVAAMGEAFRSQVKESMDRWRALLAQRNKPGAPGKRVELYRMQTRTGNVPVAAGGAAVVQYEVRPEQGGRFLERVMLLNEQEGWRPAGYAFQVVPAK